MSTPVQRLWLNIRHCAAQRYAVPKAQQAQRATLHQCMLAPTFQNLVHAQLLQCWAGFAAGCKHGVPLLLQDFAELRVHTICLATRCEPRKATPVCSRQVTWQPQVAHCFTMLLHLVLANNGDWMECTCRPIPRLAPSTTATPVSGLTAMFAIFKRSGNTLAV